LRLQVFKPLARLVLQALLQQLLLRVFLPQALLVPPALLIVLLLRVLPLLDWLARYQWVQEQLRLLVYPPQVQSAQ
jgi:hypothetical protein